MAIKLGRLAELAVGTSQYTGPPSRAAGSEQLRFLSSGPTENALMDSYVFTGVTSPAMG